MQDQRLLRPDRQGVNRPARLHHLQRAIQPAGGGAIELARAVLQHVLRFEMRADALGNGHGGGDPGLAALDHGVQGGELWVQAEGLVQLQRLVRRDGDGAAQDRIVRVAHRRDHRQAVHGSAADDHHQLAVGEGRRRRRATPQEGGGQTG